MKPRNQTTFSTQSPPTCILDGGKQTPIYHFELDIGYEMPLTRMWESLDFLFFERSTVEKSTFSPVIFFRGTEHTRVDVEYDELLKQLSCSQANCPKPISGNCLKPIVSSIDDNQRRILSSSNSENVFGFFKPV
eukprot:m.133040 g.133040  ORF g.133040 m.133040 type:complete len:134 (-) comp29648_c0_seq3:214-615(-)